MIKISDAIKALIEGNPALHFGMHHRLLNLSQVARFIQPLIEARTRKSVQPSAVLMGLSRLQKQLPTLSPTEALPYYIDRLNIHSGLCSVTFDKNKDTHREINLLINRIQAEAGYITFTEGNTEITAIIESRHWPLVGETITAQPRRVAHNLAGLGVKFQETYVNTPGLLYHLLQQLALQQINVFEVASTMTEFNIYIDHKDVMLAMDSIYSKFSATLA